MLYSVLTDELASPIVRIARQEYFVSRELKSERKDRLMRGSPRRNAIEYGILVTTASALCATMGIMIMFRKIDRLGELDLNAPFDAKKGFQELGRELSQMRIDFVGGGNGNRDNRSRGGTNGPSTVHEQEKK